MANKIAGQDDPAATASDETSPAAHTEAAALQAMKGLTEIVMRTASTASDMSRRGTPSTQEDLKAILRGFTEACQPLVGAIPRNIINDMVVGLRTVGWDAETNVALQRDTPPTLAEFENFLMYGHQACEQEVHRLEQASTGGGVGGQQSAIPIEDLQNFTYAMCFCASPATRFRVGTSARCTNEYGHT